MNHPKNLSQPEDSWVAMASVVFMAASIELAAALLSAMLVKAFDVRPEAMAGDAGSHAASWRQAGLRCYVADADADADASYEEFSEVGKWQGAI